ncbi:MAG: phosphate transporter, permease protein [Pseudobdellovibrio sp.]|jgi:phosphate transport system permease protein|nr:phosphate transporter, permease protein [Pseudobdellovibrio sp.]
MQKQVERLKRQDSVFWVVGLGSLLFALVTLLSLIIDMAMTGWPRISPAFFTSFASRFPEKAGIFSAWVGSLTVVFVTAALAIPLGVATGIYLEEYARKNWLTKIIEINILNLAGIPSITYGLMALGIFVYHFQLGQSIITAGLTLGLLILPIIIVTTREAIRTIPSHIREASYALGSTKWQTVWNHILPYSSGGILTGVVIALSRAIGETAPLLTVGALTFIAFLPTPPVMAEPPFVSFQWLMDPYTVMPIQMFNWVSRPQEEFHINAAAAGLVLLTMTLLLNATAIYIRYRFRRKYKW